MAELSQGKSILRLSGDVNNGGWAGAIGIGSKPTDEIELFADAFAESNWGNDHIVYGATAGVRIRW